jgi:hypothetical protein
MKRAWLFLLFLGLLGAAAPPPPEKPQDPLELTLTSSKKMYQKGERILLTIELLNTGSTEVVGKNQIEEGRDASGKAVKSLGILSVWGVDEDLSLICRYRLTPASDKSAKKLTDLKIRPQKSYVQRITLNELPVIETSRDVPIGDGTMKPGQHRIVVGLGPLTSNIITIEIRSL